MPDFGHLPPAADGHTRELQKRHRVKRDSTWYDTAFLVEKDASGIHVATLRTWVNQGTRPPYRRQAGWEKYSPAGRLLDREVRYSRRDTLDYLH